MSKQEPFIGPRNSIPGERELGVNIRENMEENKDAFLAGGIAILLAIVGKMLLKTETLHVGSVKKSAQSFAVVSVSGLIANGIAMKMDKK